MSAANAVAHGINQALLRCCTSVIISRACRIYEDPVIDAETRHLAVIVAVAEKRLVSLEKAGFWSKNGIRGRWTDEYREVGQHPAGTLGLPLGGNHSDPRIKLSGRCAAIPP